MFSEAAGSKLLTWRFSIFDTLQRSLPEVTSDVFIASHFQVCRLGAMLKMAREAQDEWAFPSTLKPCERALPTEQEVKQRAEKNAMLSYSVISNILFSSLVLFLCGLCGFDFGVSKGPASSGTVTGN